MDLDSYTKYEMDTEMVLMQEYDGVEPVSYTHLIRMLLIHLNSVR